MTDTGWSESELAAVAFVGEVLAPFFLEDPRLGSAGASFQAMACLDARQAAAEWPFVDDDQALGCLRDMQTGLCAGEGAGAGTLTDAGELTDVDESAIPDAEASAEAASAPSPSEAFRADDALTWEYRRLFVGPGHKAAPPWGSVYTDHDRVIFGLTTLDLRRWMREHGIERLGGPKDPEDHIGLMLELMTWLARNRPADLDEYLQLHFLTWAPHFLARMENVTTHAFYRGLARLTRLSLEGVRDCRGLRVVEPRFYS